MKFQSRRVVFCEFWGRKQHTQVQRGVRDITQNPMTQLRIPIRDRRQGVSFPYLLLRRMSSSNLRKREAMRNKDPVVGGLAVSRVHMVTLLVTEMKYLAAVCGRGAVGRGPC